MQEMAKTKYFSNLRTINLINHILYILQYLSVFVNSSYAFSL